MSNWISNIFNKKMPTTVQQPKRIESANAELSADAVREKYAKMQRATMVNQLTDANIKRTKLGAG
jgi:hypothetical protein